MGHNPSTYFILRTAKKFRDGDYIGSSASRNEESYSEPGMIEKTFLFASKAVLTGLICALPAVAGAGAVGMAFSTVGTALAQSATAVTFAASVGGAVMGGGAAIYTASKIIPALFSEEIQAVRKLIKGEEAKPSGDVPSIKPSLNSDDKSISQMKRKIAGQFSKAATSAPNSSKDHQPAPNMAVSNSARSSAKQTI